MKYHKDVKKINGLPANLRRFIAKFVKFASKILSTSRIEISFKNQLNCNATETDRKPTEKLA